MNLKTFNPNFKFVGGTIFWVDNNVLKKYFTDEMIDKIGQKLKNNDATKISYTRRSDDGVDVEFSIRDIKYKAIFNHTGTCEKLEKY